MRFFRVAAIIRRIYIVMIFDCHNDILTSGLDEKAIIREIRGYDAIGKVVCALWTSEGASLDFALKVKKRVEFCFAVEDMGFYSNRDKEKLIALKPLYCSLTWNYDNRFAGGALGKSGLTRDGADLIGLLSENNVKIDTAHLNRKSFFDVAERAAGIFCSHASVDELCHNPRNLTAEQIKIVKARGGIVGLTPIRKFNSLPLADTIDFYVQKYGVESLAVGSDFYGSTDFPEDLASYGDFVTLKERLSKKGYTEYAVNRIFYANAADFFRL